jgi:hypothetical protein
MFINQGEIAGLLTEMLGPGDSYASLHLSDPGKDGQFAEEVSGPGYKRKKISQSIFNKIYEKDDGDTIVENELPIIFNPFHWPLNRQPVTHLALWKNLISTSPDDFIRRWKLNPQILYHSNKKLIIKPGTLYFRFQRIF